MYMLCTGQSTAYIRYRTVLVSCPQNADSLIISCLEVADSAAMVQVAQHCDACTTVSCKWDHRLSAHIGLGWLWCADWVAAAAVEVILP